MNKFLGIALITIAVIAVGIADVLTKKIAFHSDNFWTALRNPLMFAVAALYITQIMVFLFVFVKKAELGIVGIIQTALYAIIVILSGILFFNEDISVVQGVGIGVAILGVILINL